MEIPFVDLKAQYQNLKEEMDKAILETVADAAFIGGKRVDDFEKAFADLYGAKHCITVANGTDSLYITMKMLGIGPGDEVITVANSWISTSETISQTGAKPVFVDIDTEFYSIDEHQIEDAITENTKMIIPVHLHGQACNMEKIMEIAEKHKLIVFEDCAQAHFSEFKENRVGLFGIAGSFSFYPGKNLGAYGDAGAIITNDDELAEKCRMFARHGALKKHEHQIEGINSRLDGIQAAVLNVKLKHILDWTEKRIKAAELYDQKLNGIGNVFPPRRRPNSKHTFHLYVIRAERRDELMAFLKENGIGTAIHYPTALPNLKAYEYLGHGKHDFPVASAYESRILSLPIFPEITEEQIEKVANTIRRFYLTK